MAVGWLAGWLAAQAHASVEDFSGCCPLLFLAADEDVSLDDSVRCAKIAREAVSQTRPDQTRPDQDEQHSFLRLPLSTRLSFVLSVAKLC